MKSYQDWLTENNQNKAEDTKKPRGKKLKKNGSVHIDSKVGQRVDLVVLPPDVEGKNCGNCMYFEKSGDIGWCEHKEVRQWVTPRMCCSLWDHKDVKRSWKK